MHNNNAHLELNSFAESFFILKTEATPRKQQADITKIKWLESKVTKTIAAPFDSNKQGRGLRNDNTTS